MCEPCKAAAFLSSHAPNCPGDHMHVRYGREVCRSPLLAWSNAQHAQIHLILERLLSLYVVSLIELCAAIHSNPTFALVTISGRTSTSPLGFRVRMTELLLDFLYGHSVPSLIQARQAIGPLGIAALDLEGFQRSALQEYKAVFRRKLPITQVYPWSVSQGYQST